MAKINIDKMTHHQKMGGDLLLPISDYDPEDRRIYHPAIWRHAWIGGLAVGTLFAVVFWAIALSYLPIAGLGQIGTSGGAVAAFFGFSLGSALGGLFGAASGMTHLLDAVLPQDAVEV